MLLIKLLFLQTFTFPKIALSIFLASFNFQNVFLMQRLKKLNLIIICLHKHNTKVFFVLQEFFSDAILHKSLKHLCLTLTL